jgi:uncharacterized membrane protein YhfC
MEAGRQNLDVFCGDSVLYGVPASDPDSALTVRREKMGVADASYTSLVLYYGFLGLTAGIFEETGRWAAFGLMKRRRRALDWKDALALGLGHGGVEAVWVAVSGLLAGNFDFTADSSQVLLGGVERLFAMTLHVGFSFLIFKGVEEKKARWWLLAVLLHGLTDFQLVIGNLAVVEGLLAIEAVAVLLLVIRFVRREERS